MTDMSQHLTQLRETHNLSQEDLAAHVHVSPQTVATWEKGELVPDTTSLISLADMYKVSLDDLVGRPALEPDGQVPASGQVAVPNTWPTLQTTTAAPEGKTDEPSPWAGLWTVLLLVFVLVYVLLGIFLHAWATAWFIFILWPVALILVGTIRSVIVVAKRNRANK